MTPATLDKVLYTAKATAIGGREGQVTIDGGPSLTVTMPKGLGGSGAEGVNPEQLFAAGYAACFGSALGHVARARRIDVGPIAIHAHVDIGPVAGRFGLAVKLVADLPGVERDVAEALVQAAHAVCPYSNATRGNIVVDVAVA